MVGEQIRVQAQLYRVERVMEMAYLTDDLCGVLVSDYDAPSVKLDRLLAFNMGEWAEVFVIQEIRPSAEYGFTEIRLRQRLTQQPADCTIKVLCDP